jgi:hypothetical protein
LRIGFVGKTKKLRVEFYRERWPAKGYDELYSDDNGLPIFCWRDPSSWLPRAVFVLASNASPENAVLVHVNGNYPSRGGKLAIYIGVPLSILAFLIFIPVWNSIFVVSYSDVRNAPFSLSAAPAISEAIGDRVVGYLWWPFGAGASVAVAILLARLMAAYITRHWAWQGRHLKISLRKWSQLTSFGIEDATEVYGNLKQVETFAGEKSRRLIIRAFFGTDDFPVEVSRSSFNAASVQALHQILTREFIQKRQDYIDALEARPATRLRRGSPASPATAARSGIPDRL